MHQTSTLLPRAASGLRSVPIKLNLPKRTWALPRQGFGHGCRQFHATPQTRFLSLITAAPVWLVVPIIGALPQLLRTRLDLLDEKDNQRKLETVGPLIDICKAITSRRRKKLSITAVSTKVDADRLAYLDQLEQKFNFRMMEKVTDDRAFFNRKVFLPSALHCAWSWSTLMYLNSKTTIAAFSQAPGMPEASAFLANPFVYTVGGCILTATFFVYMSRNPFWSHFTTITMPQVTPFWGYLYRLNPKDVVEAHRGFFVPAWLSYVRVRTDLIRKALSDKTPSELMNPIPDPERQQAFGYVLYNGPCVLLVGLMVATAGPLALLYSLGVVFGFAIRLFTVSYQQYVTRNKFNQQRAQWMPLTLEY